MLNASGLHFKNVSLDPNNHLKEVHLYSEAVTTNRDCYEVLVFSDFSNKAPTEL